jgi:excinuclease UvrABC ATPase subunit
MLSAVLAVISEEPDCCKRVKAVLQRHPGTGAQTADTDGRRPVLFNAGTKRDHGNTIIVIEHNLDVIKTADWIIDLGPEGGIGGGEIVVAGTPAEVAAHSDSYTGQFLKHTLAQQPAGHKRAVLA